MTKKPKVAAKPADSLHALADLLGFERRSLHRWSKLDGAPVEASEEAWKAFIAEKGLGKGETRDLAKLKVLIAEEQLVQIRHKNEIAAGRMIDEKTIQDFLRDWAANFDQLITSEFETNAPPQLVGKSIVEIRARMREGHERIRTATAKGLLNWKPEGAEQTA